MVAVLVVVVVHLRLLHEMLPLSAVLTDTPLSGDDFDTHVGQTYRLVAALRSAGEHWAYAPTILAGYPAGAIFDADNKGWAYFTYALSQYADISPARAHNLFVYLVGLLPPLVGMLGGYLFRLGFYPSVLAGLLCSLLLFFDTFTHWCFWVGMVAYTGASAFAVAPMGLLYRFVTERRLLWALLCAPVLGLALTLHPYTFFIVAAPMAVMVLQARSTLGGRGIAAIVGIVVTAVAINVPWLHASLIHWHHIINATYFGQGGAQIFWFDMWNQLVNPTDTGVLGQRASLRFAYAILAVGTLVSWFRQRDGRLWTLGLAAVSMFLVGYFGGHLPGLGHVQPYRHVVPAGFLLALPAAVLLVQAMRSRFFFSLPLSGKAVVACLGFLASQQFVEHALYHMPQFRPQLEPLLDGTQVPLDSSGNGIRLPLMLPHAAQFHAGVAEVTQWAREHVGTGGRVVVEEFALGERMTWDGDIDVIGGFRFRNLEHSYCNILRVQQGQRISEAQLRAYVQTYGITHFVMYREHPEFDHMPAVLEPLGRLHYRRLYRVRRPSAKIAGSNGEVRPGLNSLRVDGTDPEAPLLLRYHFHPSLRCRPNCRLERVAIGGPDPVGFIRVKAPHPPAFEIYNGY